MFEHHRLGEGGGEAMPDVRSLAEGLGATLSPALKSFFKTVAGMALLGLLLVLPCYFLGARVSSLGGVLGALLGLVVSIGLGVPLAGKRAALVGLMAALKGRRLGGVAVEQAFARLLGVTEDEAMGARGGEAARAIERLPLAELEARLRREISGLIGAPEEGGGLRSAIKRRAQQALLTRVEEITLAELRERGADAGGVDLIKVRDLVAQKADAMIEEQLSSA